MFDLLAGLWPRPALIIRTVLPANHRLNMWTCFTAMSLTAIGSVGETIFALYLYGTHFYAWSLRVRYATPVLHIMFVCAQLNTSWIMWMLFKRHRRALHLEKDGEIALGSDEGEREGDRLSGEQESVDDAGADGKDRAIPLIEVTMVDVHCMACVSRRRSVRDVGC
jgi:hypothetical protein